MLSQAPAREIGLAEITVPNDRLPAGCGLAAAPSERLERNRVRSGLWTGLNIRTNPWIGIDVPILAAIHERLAPTEAPDGPPLTPVQARRYFLRLADGIDQAYVAIYREQDVSDLTTVYGLQFPTTEAALAFARNVRAASNAVVNGRIAAFSAGHDSDCFQAIREYVSRLSR